MIGWTLGRYFFLRYVVITTYFLLGSFALALILDFTELSGKLSSLPDYSAIQAFGLSAMRIPYIMQQVFPFIALFAAMATLISLNRKYELVVARSVGVSAWQFLLPACTGAFLFGLAAVLVVNPLAAWGFERSEQITANWRAGKANDVSADRVPWLRQKTEDGETIIGAKSIVNRGLRLIDATFIRLDKNQDILERLDAKTADLDDGFWRLNDVTKFVLGETPVSQATAQIPTHLRPEFVEESLARPETIPFLSCVTKLPQLALLAIQPTLLTCISSLYWLCPHS